MVGCSRGGNEIESCRWSRVTQVGQIAGHETHAIGKFCEVCLCGLQHGVGKIEPHAACTRNLLKDRLEITTGARGSVEHHVDVIIHAHNCGSQLPWVEKLVVAFVAQHPITSRSFVPS